MEGAEGELSSLRAQHATALEQLAVDERETSAELEGLARRFDGWADEVRAAFSAASRTHAQHIFA